MAARKAIAAIVGTRPEAIKMAPLLLELHKRHVNTVLLLTSQHRRLVTSILKYFDLKPNYDLRIMKPDQKQPYVAARVIEKLERCFKNISPCCVLVQGDTTSAAAAALTAYYMEIPVGHVEAGLRSYDTKNPFPEEVNRKVISSVASLHFAPTPENRTNLIKEGITKGIHVTGNPVVDALSQILTGPQWEKTRKKIERLCDAGPVILATVHRRENHGERLEEICAGLLKIASRFKNHRIVFPVHPNPNVSKVVKRLLSGKENIALIKPLDYPDFICLMRRAAVILSDSGGVQEEAPSLDKTVFVLREKTERPEAVQAGWSRLIGTRTERIYSEVSRFIDAAPDHIPSTERRNPYGDGKAAFRICNVLMDFIHENRSHELS